MTLRLTIEHPVHILPFLRGLAGLRQEDLARLLACALTTVQRAENPDPKVHQCSERTALGALMVLGAQGSSLDDIRKLADTIVQNKTVRVVTVEVELVDEGSDRVAS